MGEIRNVLCTLGEQLRGDELDTLLEDMEDRDGLIDYRQFVVKVMNG